MADTAGYILQAEALGRTVDWSPRGETQMIKFGLMAVAATVLLAAQPAAAQQYPNPYKAGDYWGVTGVHVKPGGTLKTANDIAAVWQKQQEHAKSKGWIKGYKILTNSFPRENEPNIYLITMFDRLPTPDESDARGVEMRAFMNQTGEQMQAAAAGRAEFSSPGSSSLLREWVKR
ncbi:MAG: hypothetical protein ACOYLS_07150 [Polymorphobacter sp.]